VVPVITVGGSNLGTASGAATPAAVNAAADIVGLFNSAASRAGGLLSKAQDASVYATQYAAFAQLNRAANRSTTKTSYGTALGAASLLGTNLAAQLQITAADTTRYGVTGATPNNVKDLVNGLIVSVKAFRMGLTNSILLPAMRDDPHQAFADGRSTTVPPMLKTALDAFMTDLQTTTDTVTNKVLADDITITFNGDTPKNVLNNNGWPDGTVGNGGQNFLWVYSSGHLKSGWFGSVLRNGTVNGYDAAGNQAAYSSANTAKMALASVAYAIAKRDDRLSGQFANGIQVSGVFGNPKLV
jgi:hypothetical protein